MTDELCHANSRASDEGDLNSGPNGSSNNSSRSSSRSSGASRNGSSSRSGAAAVDLRLLRPASHHPAVVFDQVEGADDDDDGDKDVAQVSGLEMKTWMLFWQQQQSCNTKLPFPSQQQQPDFARETGDQQQRQQPTSLNPPNVDESTMRQLLGIYGLQREASLNSTGLPPGKLLAFFISLSS